MENQNISKQDCGCGENCCTPKKSRLWTRVIFIIIILAAGTIIALKLVGNHDKEADDCCEATENSNCC